MHLVVTVRMPDSGGSSDEESVLLRKQAEGKKGSKQVKKVEGSDINGALYESNRSVVPVAAAGGATYTTEIDTEHDRDQRAMLEMAIAAQEDGRYILSCSLFALLDKH